jgi:hypothetical protein
VGGSADKNVDDVIEQGSWLEEARSEVEDFGLWVWHRC